MAAEMSKRAARATWSGFFLFFSAISAVSAAHAKSADDIERDVIEEMSGAVTTLSQRVPGAVVIRTATPYLKVPSDQKDAAYKEVFEIARKVCVRNSGRLLDGYEPYYFQSSQKRGISFPRVNLSESSLWTDPAGEPSRIDHRSELRLKCSLKKNALFYVALDVWPSDPRWNALVEDLSTRRIYWFAPVDFSAFASQVPAMEARLKARQDPILASLASAENAKEQRRQQEVEDSNRRYEERKAAAAQSAEAAFYAAANRAKQVGTTVCTADNWVGQVEQVAGIKIKVSVSGRALGFYGEYKALGPFEIGGSQGIGGGIIKDRYYLFRGVPDLRLSKEARTFWDDGSRWGACDYGFG